MYAVGRFLLTFALLLSCHGAMASERMLPVSQATAQAASLIKTAREQGTVKVIVGFRVAFAAEGKLKASEASTQRAEIAKAAASFQSRFAAAIQRKPDSFRSYSSIPFVAVEVTPDELTQLMNDPLVASVSKNAVAKTQLADSVPMIRADEAQRSGFSGAGQTVAIIDTGVDKSHPFLAGRVVAEACFAYDRNCPGRVTASTAPGSGVPCPDARYCTHGTHVAGIIAGRDGTSTGVAPDATLIAVQVFSRDGGAYDSDIVAGLDYVYSRRNDFKIAAVNMSLGGGIYPETCESEKPAMESMLATLRSAGIATVVASGNDFIPIGISHPACSPSAIAVGAVSTKDWGNCLGEPENGPTAKDKVACYSNSSSQLALLAPGSPIRSSVPNNKFAVFNGTSMATPHVAGAFAVLRQKKPGASVNEILEALSASGVMVSDYRSGQETPRIDVKAGLDFLERTTLKLSYKKAGTGQGTVTFSPGVEGRNSCAGSCVLGYATAKTVTLTAAPAAGSTFMGWEGDCQGMGPCSVALGAERAVTATFSRANVSLTFTRNGTGSGTIGFVSLPYSSIEECAGNCTNPYLMGSYVLAYPFPDYGSTFGGWSGACTGAGLCVVQMTEAKSLGATFTRQDGSETLLTYTAAGKGSGSVSFRPISTNFSCERNCTNAYKRGTVVNLSAEASSDSLFTGWSGACKGTGDCTLSMSNNQKVTANFQRLPDIMTLNLAVSGTGTGSVQIGPDGGNAVCQKDCLNRYAAGARVRLSVKGVDPRSVFVGWTGACRGKGTCNVRMTRDQNVGAIFNARPVYTLNFVKAGAGSGTVSFSPEGDAPGACTSSCAKPYLDRTKVTLTATAAAGSVFSGWSGACRGKRTCTVTMSAARTVTATFASTTTVSSTAP